MARLLRNNLWLVYDIFLSKKKKKHKLTAFTSPDIYKIFIYFTN